MSKFKVGDIIRITQAINGVDSNYVGLEQVVVSIDTGVAGMPIGTDRFYLSIDQIELVKSSEKNSHYTTDSTGKDYLQRFFENSTPEEVKGAMVFTMGKYIDRLGKKDAPEKELAKIIDYATRYRDFLNK